MSEEGKEEEKREEKKEEMRNPYEKTFKVFDWEKERLQREIELLELKLRKCELEKKLSKVTSEEEGGKE